MKVNKLIEKYNFKLLTDTDTDIEINGIYSSDLLSFVMANGESGNAWITVQSHKNILAVASLVEFSCIILPFGVDTTKDVIDKANQEGINILETDLDHYEINKIFFNEEMNESLL
ncbi:MAG: AraC family transcriptional regulator [Bacillota bacterium]|nr:AraC family transcriptional regulator [Bacillota bacterium]